MTKSKKIPISIRVKGTVMEWFKNAQPKGYQTLMHSVLEDYVERQIERKVWSAGRAQELFRRYYAQCFWHYDKDLKIGPENMQLVIDGLRAYAGSQGLLLAEELCR